MAHRWLRDGCGIDGGYVRSGCGMHSGRDAYDVRCGIPCGILGRTLLGMQIWDATVPNFTFSHCYQAHVHLTTTRHGHLCTLMRTYAHDMY